jgi:1-deoxy-D-xylulose-5-phosphate reductoisomerase
MNKKKVIILGGTGSIGQSALAVIRKESTKLELTGISAHTNEEQLLELQSEFNTPVLALSGRKPISDKIRYWGSEGLTEMLHTVDADIVINGIAGSSGLLPSIAVLESGKDLALANKETIVMAGELIKGIAEKHGKAVIPVDSEHSAIFHLLQKVPRENLAEIILTASGGAFRNYAKEELPYVTMKQALVHPTWSMGTKITIDCATMANKGLELIETHHLFNAAPDIIKVVIHPQSYVHSMIRTREGSIYAQISKPDMRVPIQNAFSYPELYSNVEPFDLIGKKLEFFAPDFDRYKMLEIAYTVMQMGKSYPIVYNAANEIAVEAFTKEKISFPLIPSIVSEALQDDWSAVAGSTEEVMEVHALAVHKADIILKKFNLKENFVN